MNLDAKVRWKVPVKEKREELSLKYKNMYWLLGRKSKLSVNNKLLIYKQILKPVWTYGIQLWGCTAKTNMEIIQRFQNVVLREIIDAPWYCRNKDIHRDLGIDYVEDTISKFAASHQQRLAKHTNEEASKLLVHSGPARRLKRVKPLDLIK